MNSIKNFSKIRRYIFTKGLGLFAGGLGANFLFSNYKTANAVEQNNIKESPSEVKEMHICAPVSGYIMVTQPTPSSVKSGDILFRYDTKSSELDIAAANAAFEILRRVNDRLDIIDKNSSGEQRKSRQAAVYAAEKMVEVYDKYYKLLNDEEKQFGTVVFEKLFFSKFIPKSARVYASSTRLGLAQIERGFDEARVILPSMISYVEAIHNNVMKQHELLTVHATKDGLLTFKKITDGWVDQGTILASYPISLHQPKKVVTSPISGVLQSIHVSNGSITKSGSVIATLDQSGEDLQLLQLSLIDNQLDLALKRLSPEAMAVKRDALDCKLKALQANYDYRKEVYDKTYLNYGLGLTDLEHVLPTEAAVYQATAELMPAKAESSVIDLLVNGAEKNIDAYKNIISLKRKLIQSQRDHRVILAPITGTLVWYVTEGSFVEAGTLIAGIM